VRYVPEEPRSWISSSLVSALSLPVSDGYCSLNISVEACHDSLFIFSQPLVQFGTQSPQLLLGNDVIAGRSVSVGLERINFPVRSMLIASCSIVLAVDSKCPMQL
jgi:hypothetical protein